MLRSPLRHGCLFLAVSWLAAANATAASPAQVHTSTFEIHYEVNNQALPLHSVNLWYTLDRGNTWINFGADPDRQSPIVFDAPQEGLYGFLVVLTNASGSSSALPRPGQEPQSWARVDLTPPIVQLHPLRQSHHLGRRTVQVRWTAIDTHFGARPIRIEYRRSTNHTWALITDEPLANTGRYDWLTPDGVMGSIEIRVTATDTGGHRVHGESRIVEIPDPNSTAAATTNKPGHNTATQPRRTASLQASNAARRRADLLFIEASTFQDRGEFPESIARLREVVRLDPQRAEAFAEMAKMLYGLGNTDRALSAYQLALQQEPTMRSALRGAAMAYRKKGNHNAAAGALRSILRGSPNDAEVWMNLGDVAIFQGDEVLARECYTRASNIDPEATEIVADARKRLDLMASVSRIYQSSDR